MQPYSLEHLLTQTRTALVLIDVQNEFCHDDGAFGKRGLDMSLVEKMMSHLVPLVDAARDNDVPVIFVQNVEDESTDSCAWSLRPDAGEEQINEGVCRRGTWGTGFYRFEPTEKDIVVEKHRFSAFVDTELNDILTNLNIETLIFTGVATNICVETSARHAVMLDYHVILAEDACASWFPDLHESTKKNIGLWFGKVTKADEIINIWEHKSRP